MTEVSASDPAQNPYWKRDVRRAYPQLSVITQPNLSTFLLQEPSKQAYVVPVLHILHIETHVYPQSP